MCPDRRFVRHWWEDGFEDSGFSWVGFGERGEAGVLFLGDPGEGHRVERARPVGSRAQASDPEGGATANPLPTARLGWRGLAAGSLGLGA